MSLSPLSGPASVQMLRDLPPPQKKTTSTSSSSTKPEAVTEFASLDFGSLLDEVDHLEAEAQKEEHDVHNSRTWKPQFAVGDEVSARWHDDDQYYDAVIDALLDGGRYRITFSQYNNSQETAEIDIRPSASVLFVIAERKLALQKAEQSMYTVLNVCLLM